MATFTLKHKKRKIIVVYASVLYTVLYFLCFTPAHTKKTPLEMYIVLVYVINVFLFRRLSECDVRKTKSVSTSCIFHAWNLTAHKSHT